MIVRQLARHEIETIWSIDRSEVHHHIYQLRDNHLVLTAAYFELHGWPPGQIEHNTPLLYACFDRGGAFVGMFHDQKLVGVAVVDGVPLGAAGDQLQLKYLYVSRDYRGHGVGTRLFQEASAIARTRIDHVAQTPGTWAGGTTRAIYAYPPEAIGTPANAQLWVGTAVIERPPRTASSQVARAFTFRSTAMASACTFRTRPRLLRSAHSHSTASMARARCRPSSSIDRSSPLT